MTVWQHTGLLDAGPLAMSLVAIHHLAAVTAGPAIERLGARFTWAAQKAACCARHLIQRHMIRVAYAAPMPHGGGALNYLIDLVEHHDRRVIDPVVFVDDTLRNAEQALERLRRCGVSVHRGPMAAPLDQFLKTGWWKQALRDAGPFDVANLHQHVPGVGRAFLEGARRAGIPLLMRTEQLPRFPPHDRLTLNIRRLGLRIARSRLAAITDAAIVVSEAGRAALAARGEPAARITSIPTAFCEAAFRTPPDRATVRAALGLPIDATVVGFLASLTEQKQPGLFLDAAARLIADGCKAIFVLGGDGPQASTIRRRIAELGSQVREIGHRRDLPEVLSALDVFVLPSLWEGMPLTVLEAMRAGAAVVASDVDGTSEVIRDRVTGRLVPKADAAALTEAIRDLVNDPASRRRMADAGMQHVTGRFDASSLAQRTEDLYRSTLVTY